VQQEQSGKQEVWLSQATLLLPLAVQLLGRLGLALYDEGRCFDREQQQQQQQRYCHLC
jgi:hypothetical protein